MLFYPLLPWDSRLNVPGRALRVPSALQELGQMLGHIMSRLSLCSSALLGGVRSD